MYSPYTLLSNSLRYFSLFLFKPHVSEECVNTRIILTALNRSILTNHVKQVYEMNAVV